MSASIKTDMFGKPYFETARFPNVTIIVDFNMPKNRVRTSVVEGGDLEKEISVDHARHFADHLNKQIEFYDSPYHQWCMKKTGKL